MPVQAPGTPLEIRQFSCLKDNFGVLIHDPATGVTASIDAPEAEPVQRALDEAGWKLTHILVTHHHADHTAGIADLKAKSGAIVIGPHLEASRIPEIEQEVREGDRFEIGSFEVRVLETPGHTVGHVTYWIPSANVAFVGDTLFAMGCGRVLEGDHEMMCNSLKKIASLPPETVLYCGHEYTLANAQFGMTIEPENKALEARLHEVEALRAAGKPTLPTLLSQELQTNVFLRPHVFEIRNRLGLPAVSDWKVFAEMRVRKNKA
jgi:hydroxyacylglutathione hydrolase